MSHHTGTSCFLSCFAPKKTMSHHTGTSCFLSCFAPKKTMSHHTGTSCFLSCFAPKKTMCTTGTSCFLSCFAPKKTMSHHTGTSCFLSCFAPKKTMSLARSRRVWYLMFYEYQRGSRKNNNENMTNLIRRFTKRVQGSGVLKRVRSIRYSERSLSKFTKRKRRSKGSPELPRSID